MSETSNDPFTKWSEETGVAAALIASDTPATWFNAKFPRLEEVYGVAVEEYYPEKNGQMPEVRDLSEDFMAATLGECGCPDEPTVFVATENRFYAYSLNEGIYVEEREARLAKRLSELLLACARDCAENFDTSKLSFKFRDTANLRGVLQRAQGQLEVGADFFENDVTEFLACKNGMLRLKDGELLPFAPSFRRRNKLGVDYIPDAQCPMFLDGLMRPALDAEDIDLLQRWCGLALIGVNLAQRFPILTGTAGGGKGTFIRVLMGIIGAGNMATLRPNLLAERFEVGRFLGRTLLYGADVPENFLNCRDVATLKALTGGDPVTLEFKGSNERPSITCRFNAIVTCNSRLTVHLEGDVEAWRRRLAIVEYKKPKPEKVIADFSERIVREEGSGVLNWMLEGLLNLRRDHWQLRLTEAQQKKVDDLLLESEADRVFAEEMLERREGAQLTVSDCYEAYVQFCNERGWVVMARKKFSNGIGDTITRLFSLTLRHDVPDQQEKPQRGWKGLGLKQ